MNQSKLEVIACLWGKARENACECATVLLVLLLIIVNVLIGWKRGASFSSQSYGVVDVKPMTFGQSNRLVSIYYLDFSVVFWRLPSWFLSWNLICITIFGTLCRLSWTTCNRNANIYVLIKYDAPQKQVLGSVMIWSTLDIICGVIICVEWF